MIVRDLIQKIKDSPEWVIDSELRIEVKNYSFFVEIDDFHFSATVGQGATLMVDDNNLINVGYEFGLDEGKDIVRKETEEEFTNRMNNISISIKKIYKNTDTIPKDELLTLIERYKFD